MNKETSPVPLDTYEVFPTISARSESENTEGAYQKRQATYMGLTYSQAFGIATEAREMLWAWFNGRAKVEMTLNQVRVVLKEIEEAHELAKGIQTGLAYGAFAPSKKGE